MSRRIIYRPKKSPGLTVLSGESPDSIADRLAKLMPTETVAAYASLVGILDRAPTGGGWAAWAVLALLWLLTPVYIYRRTTKKSADQREVRAPWGQIVLATGMFGVWAYFVGGPFQMLPGYDRFWGSLGLIVVSVVAPLVVESIDRP